MKGKAEMDEEGFDSPRMKGTKENIECYRFSRGEWKRVGVHVPMEMELTIYVNQQELVHILCSPTKLNCLVFGFLYSEGIISGIRDVASMRLCEDESLADVRLKDQDYKLPSHRTITSGCAGGTTFETRMDAINSDLVLEPAEIISLMHQFQDRMELYRKSGGVHTSALADRGRIIVVGEDIGRHNTLDKIQGECLLMGIPTRDRILLSTGRVSSEMLIKAARMGTPIVVSRHSPTDKAISLSRDLGIALIGHARADSLSVYSHKERLRC